LDTDPYFSIIPIITADMAAMICFVAALLLAAALLWIITGFESALLSLSPNEVKALENNPAVKQISGWLRQPERMWAILSVAGSFVRVVFVALAVYLFQFVAVWGWWLIVALWLIVETTLSQMRASQRTLSGLPVWLTVFEKIFRPLTTVLATSTTCLHKRTQKKQSISIGKIWKASETVIENENILKGIVKFGHINTHTIMTPRIDVEAVGLDVSFPDLIRLINECGYSRLPVYNTPQDNVKGILYVKDLLPYIDEETDFKWQSLIRDAYFVPENKKIDDLLKEFQEKKNHIAVIIDEYGSMVGIVTLEDILEEIMGEIADELDNDEPDYEQINSNTYLFDGKVLLNDFYRIMQVEDSVFDDIKGEADTLAGIILELKGEIPQKGDCVDYRNLSFCVEEMENRRIKQIKVMVK
jgi:gliding motility-associated protein GldE